MHILPNNIAEYFKGCLIPQVSLIDWITKYDIPTRPLHCPLCSKELKPLFPVALNKSIRFSSSTKEKRLQDKKFAQDIIDYLTHIT